MNTGDDGYLRTKWANCTHPSLYFGSGGYYIFCSECDARWARMGQHPEYGTDAAGNRIGADPGAVTSQTIGVYDRREDATNG